MPVVPDSNVKLRSLEPYRHLFPDAPDVDHTVKKGASVSDTVAFIPAIVRRDHWHVTRYVDKELRGLPTYEACKKLWYFIKYHIEYEKDERGAEQVRSGRRLIKDGKGDCDCFTTFINKCLYNLQIPYTNRITKYSEDYFQHIYPIVPIGNGKYIVMDCVAESFNYEVPYTEKQDYAMDLQYLDGIQDSDLVGIDARDLFGQPNDLAELGKLLKKRGGGSAPAKKGLFKKKTPEQKQAKKAVRKEKRQAVKKKVMKVVNKVNKINPVTALLRAGLLASMKLNIAKVAGLLKWGYATKEFAASKGMEMRKYNPLKNILSKTEDIFFAAGGKKENLRKAILTGKGNANREVAGLDSLDEFTRLPDMLGELYQDEFVNGMEGFGELGQLGEPATAAAITAASASIGAIAALLKSLGPLFPKKKSAASHEAPAESGAEEPAPAEEGASEPLPDSETEPSPPEEGPEPDSSGAGGPEEENLPAETEAGGEVAPNEEPETEPEPEVGSLAGAVFSGQGLKALWEKNKSWMKPAGIIAAVAVVGFIAKKIYDSQTTKGNNSRNLDGIPKHHKKKKGGHQKYGKKTMIPLS
jgi:hypothetical protein